MRHCHKVETSSGLTEACIKGECNRILNPDASKILMLGIDEVIGFFRNQSARHTQNGAFRTCNPSISHALCGDRNWVAPPIGREILRHDIGNHRIAEFNAENDKIRQYLRRVQVHEELQSGERPGLRGVDYRPSRRVPPATEESCAFSGKGAGRIPGLHDSPCAEIQE
jgi:hypothetical protein